MQWAIDTLAFNLFVILVGRLGVVELTATGIAGNLNLIVFLPAVDGLRPQWREASASLGGSAWSYWRHIGGPVLAPSFTGATLLLFANAFSAYATAAALISQGSPIAPLKIREFLTSEVVLGQANVGKALALGMVVIISVVMTLYALLQRRSGRWLR